MTIYSSIQTDQRLMTVVLLLLVFVQKQSALTLKIIYGVKSGRITKKIFLNYVDRSNFNKRRRRLHLFIHEVTRYKSEELNSRPSKSVQRLSVLGLI